MRTDLQLGALGLAVIVVATAFVGTGGCSSSDSGDDETEAGVDSSVPEAAPEDDGGDDGGQTYEQCAAMCATTHAAGKAAQDGVDSCWMMHCNDVCVGDGGTFMPSPDAGEGGASVSCGTADMPVDTGNSVCDLCTTEWCCTPYEACDTLPDCAAYGTCMDACDALDEN
ncbi:MAG TPA: hypothetical protein VIF62_32375 [Labilithrix sp.]|jgi:hypothetical protein